MSADKHWVGTWSAAPAPSEAGVGFNNHTLRMNPRISAGGSQLRVRVSNAYGSGKLVIGAATIGIRDQGPAIISGSERKLTFCGADSAIIAAGALLISDTVELEVEPLADLAVTLYIPGEVPPGFQVTGRYARQTNYISPPGNFSTRANMPVLKITDEWFFLCGIDVEASRETGCVVALGDSLTDANISTHDAYCRWPDQLARRLSMRTSGRPMAVLNQGLGGNRILHDLRGDSGLKRFDRDVLAQAGVSHAIVMLGTNDLRNRYARADEEVNAMQMIAGLNQMALRAQARGIKLYAATLTPFGNETYMAGAWNPGREVQRCAFNEWIRGNRVLDGFVDFDAALRDPQCPTQMLRVYDCGDGLHPSDLGYNRLGDVIDLGLFDD
jgi:lysophospholipase L1-like esterase